MGIGIKELLIILVVVIVVFGTKRFRTIGGDVGEAIKGFRKAMKDDEKDKEAEKASELPKNEADEPVNNDKTP